MGHQWLLVFSDVNGAVGRVNTGSGVPAQRRPHPATPAGGLGRRTSTSSTPASTSSVTAAMAAPTCRWAQPTCASSLSTEGCTNPLGARQVQVIARGSRQLQQGHLPVTGLPPHLSEYFAAIFLDMRMRSRTRSPRSSRNPRHSGGMTLIEVLVTLVIISVGLLGIAALQLTTVRNNYDAFVRAQAAMLASDMLDRMRANRRQAGTYVAAIGEAAATRTGRGRRRYRAMASQPQRAAAATVSAASPSTRDQRCDHHHPVGRALAVVADRTLRFTHQQPDLSAHDASNHQ